MNVLEIQLEWWPKTMIMQFVLRRKLHGANYNKQNDNSMETVQHKEYNLFVIHLWIHENNEKLYLPITFCTILKKKCTL